MWNENPEESGISFLGFDVMGSRGLMDRALDLKPKVVGSNPSSGSKVHNCSPGAAQSAAHCSRCVHLDGLNAENTFHI